MISHYGTFPLGLLLKRLQMLSVLEVVGKAILTSMENESPTEYTFKKKDRITPIETSSIVTIDGENVPVDPQLLFQRLVTAAGDFYDNPQEMFRY